MYESDYEDEKNNFYSDFHDNRDLPLRSGKKTDHYGGPER